MPQTVITSKASHTCIILSVHHRSESTEEQFTPRVKVRRPCPAYNKKGTNFHNQSLQEGDEVSRSHLPATLPKRPRETLNYLRVIARDWAISLSSTQAAFLFGAFTKRRQSSP